MIKCNSPNVSAWLDRKINGVFEPQSSRCLAYLNERPPPPLHPPIHPPCVPSPRQRVDWSRKLCVCFYSSSSQSASGWKSTCRDIKGCRATPPPPPPPSPQRDNAGRRISHRPAHPWLYSATAECFRSCLTGSEVAIVLSSLICVCVCVRADLKFLLVSEDH